MSSSKSHIPKIYKRLEHAMLIVNSAEQDKSWSIHATAVHAYMIFSCPTPNYCSLWSRMQIHIDYCKLQEVMKRYFNSVTYLLTWPLTKGRPSHNEKKAYTLHYATVYVCQPQALQPNTKSILDILHTSSHQP